eukprot:Gb_01469 [translate_table: standard]
MVIQWTRGLVALAVGKDKEGLYFGLLILLCKGSFNCKNKEGFRLLFHSCKMMNASSSFSSWGSSASTCRSPPSTFAMTLVHKFTCSPKTLDSYGHYPNSANIIRCGFQYRNAAHEFRLAPSDYPILPSDRGLCESLLTSLYFFKILGTSVYGQGISVYAMSGIGCKHRANIRMDIGSRDPNGRLKIRSALGLGRQHRYNNMENCTCQVR